MYSDHSRNPASTSARATLSTSTPPSTMFVQHPQTSPLTRILVLPMRVCIRQTSHRGGSGSSQGRMERARRTRSWPSARSSRWPTSLQKHQFCVFLVQEETVDQTDKQKKIVLQQFPFLTIGKIAYFLRHFNKIWHLNILSFCIGNRTTYLGNPIQETMQ